MTAATKEKMNFKNVFTVQIYMDEMCQKIALSGHILCDN